MELFPRWWKYARKNVSQTYKWRYVHVVRTYRQSLVTIMEGLSENLHQGMKGGCSVVWLNHLFIAWFKFVIQFTITQ